MIELDLRILKSIISNKFIAVDFASTYNADLFSNDVQLFARLMLGYIKGYKAPPTKRVLTEWAGEAYINIIDDIWDKIDNYEYDIREYPFDLDQLKKIYVDSSLNDIKNIIESPQDNNQTLKNISRTLQNIKVIKDGKTFIHKTAKENVDEFEERYNAKVNDPNNQFDNVLTGYSGIDFATGGLKKADLFLVCGESGAGKTQLLVNIAIQVWLQKNTIHTPPSEFTNGQNITFFSLEMPYEECYSRFISRLAQVSERSISNAILTSDERKRIADAEKFIKAYPYEFDIVDVARGADIEQIEMRYNDALLKYEPHLVVVDYMGIMQGGENEQDWLKMGEVSKELHEFGRAYNIIMGSAVQLTDIQRGSKTDPKDKSIHQKVGPHRIGRSSMILHHATLGIQIESKPGDSESFLLNYHIIKNRRGPKISAVLNKDFDLCSLTDIEYTPSKVREQIKTKKIDVSNTSDISDAVSLAMKKSNIIEIKKRLNN